jgi:hypothetical protein
MLGSYGVGEGIVWTCTSKIPGFRTDDLVFKVKGQKHSDSKVKVLAPVDVEKVNNIKAFVDYVITDHRLEKGIENLKQQGLDIDIVNTGPFLKWVGNDVIKEETDTLQASGLNSKEVMGAVSKAARDWFIKHIDKSIGIS